MTKEFSKAPWVYALCVIMIVLSTACCLLRLWAKILYSHSANHKLWWDDLFAFVTWPFSMVVIAMTLAWLAKGLGDHIIYLFFHVEWLFDGLRYYFVAATLYTAAVTCPKYSMLFFYARLFGTRSKAFKFHLWFAGASVTAWFIYAVVSSGATFICFRPLTKVPHSCITSFTYYTVAAAINVVVDVYILVIPIPPLLNLKLDKTKKAQLVAMFLLGGTIVVISIGRLISIIVVQLNDNVDLTWDLVPMFAWAVSEGPILIFGLCLPSINFLLQRLRRHGIGSLFSRKIPVEQMRPDTYEKKKAKKLQSLSSSGTDTLMSMV